MPVYEYECARCHSHFERRQGFDEAPITACPECKGKASRVIQAVSVVYKGSGWYVTDYARKSIVGANAAGTAIATVDGVSTLILNASADAGVTDGGNVTLGQAGNLTRLTALTVDTRKFSSGTDGTLTLKDMVVVTLATNIVCWKLVISCRGSI